MNANEVSIRRYKGVAGGKCLECTRISVCPFCKCRHAMMVVPYPQMMWDKCGSHSSRQVWQKEDRAHREFHGKERQLQVCGICMYAIIGF